MAQQPIQVPSAEEVLDQKKACQVKYALLYSFAISTNWPDGYFQKKESFVIGVTGPKQFPEFLLKIQQSKKIQNLPVSIKWIEKPEESTSCDLLFIAEGTPDDVIDKIETLIKDQPKFTVSDRAELKSSVAVFKIVDGTVKFVLQPDQVKDRKLKVDPRLQRLSL